MSQYPIITVHTELLEILAGKVACTNTTNDATGRGFASALWLKIRSINSDALYVREFFTLGESAVKLYQFLLFHVTELVP